MARINSNLPAKKYKVGERTERTLRFKWDGGAGGNTMYIDIAHALSTLNRRAYRQGLYYYVSGGYFVNGSMAHLSINSIPDNYTTKLAWKRGFQAWNKMNARATATDGAPIFSDYHDFKVSYGPAVGNPPMPPVYGSVGAGDTPQAYLTDDWDMSEFVSEDPVDADPRNNDHFLIHMLGANTGSDNAWTSVGLIHSLDQTYPRMAPEPHQPTLDDDVNIDPIANLFDAGETHQDIREHLDDQNDATPYDRDLMVGATSIHEGTPVALCRTSSGSGAKVDFGGFCAPLGLLQVELTDFSASGDIGLVELVLEITPGPYNGVYAERIV